FSLLLHPDGESGRDPPRHTLRFLGHLPGVEFIDRLHKEPVPASEIIPHNRKRQEVTEWPPLVSSGAEENVGPEIEHHWELDIPLHTGIIIEYVPEPIILLHLVVKGVDNPGDILIVADILFQPFTVYQTFFTHTISVFSPDFS